MSTQTDIDSLTEGHLRHGGQIAALKAAIVALIDSHPDRAAFGTYLREVNERLTSYFLASQASEEFVAQFQQETAELQKRCEPS